MLSLYKERLYINCYGYAETMLKLLVDNKYLVPTEKILENPIFKSNTVRYK